MIAEEMSKEQIIYKDSLALLDPCDILSSAAKIRAKLTILTTSGSPLAGQIKGCDLSELKKYTPSFVMKLWSDEEINYLGNVDKRRLEMFSYRDGDTAYFVPRWLHIDDDEVLQCLDDAMTESSREGLAAYIPEVIKILFVAERAKPILVMIDVVESHIVASAGLLPTLEAALLIKSPRLGTASMALRRKDDWGIFGGLELLTVGILHEIASERVPLTKTPKVARTLKVPA